jgi:Flp pilus assembly protein TadG
MCRILSPLRNLLRAQHGTQTVEFAMILPVLLLLLFGMIDFGRGYFSWLIITNGAREGARAASVGKTASVINTKVQDSISGLYTTSIVSGTCPTTEGAVCITTANAGGASGTAVTVNVRYNFKFLVIPSLMTLIGPSTIITGVFPLNASATMRLE